MTDFAFKRMQDCQTLYLGDQPITVAEVMRPDTDRTVYRVKIEPFGNLPQIVFVKQRKDGWEKEFQQEVEAYQKLEKLQGTLIPQFFGLGSFDGCPAIILSEVIGTTLHKIACDKDSDTQADTLKPQLEEAFSILSDYGAVYWDQKLDNFLLCNEGGNAPGNVMIVDLEQVRFFDESRPWELKVNPSGARSLMRDFDYIRNLRRDSSYSTPSITRACNSNIQHESRTTEFSDPTQSKNAVSYPSTAQSETIREKSTFVGAEEPLENDMALWHMGDKSFWMPASETPFNTTWPTDPYLTDRNRADVEDAARSKAIRNESTRTSVRRASGTWKLEIFRKLGDRRRKWAGILKARSARAGARQTIDLC